MYKLISGILTIAIVLGLLSGCHMGQETTRPEETPVNESLSVPATNPPVTAPPTTAPSTTEPPATTPPVTNPPTIEPPATTPPATNPPTTEPPATTPPATDPPTTEPPSAGSEVIAGGKWQGGPASWQVTKDGVLTITGTYHISSTGSTYIWKEYADIITTIIIKDGPISIPQNAFSNMEKVTTVEIGSTIETIDHHAFFGCTNLRSVSLPKSLKTLGERVFAECPSLASVTFHPSCPLTDIPQYAFYRSGIRSFVSHPNLRTIQAYAFKECTKLESVRLADGVQKAKSHAFQGCSNLKNIYIGESIEDFSAYVFSDCKAITTMEIYSPAFREFNDLPNLTTLVLGGKRTASGRFSRCPALKSVTILSPLTEISDSAFEGSSLTSITIPSTVVRIGNSAFRRTKLNKVTIPASVTDIGLAAFLESDLKEIVFKGNFPAIVNGGAFSDANATAYYPANNETWTESARSSIKGSLTWVPN